MTSQKAVRVLCSAIRFNSLPIDQNPTPHFWTWIIVCLYLKCPFSKDNVMGKWLQTTIVLGLKWVSSKKILLQVLCLLKIRVSTKTCIKTTRILVQVAKQKMIVFKRIKNCLCYGALGVHPTREEKSGTRQPIREGIIFKCFSRAGVWCRTLVKPEETRPFSWPFRKGFFSSW